MLFFLLRSRNQKHVPDVEKACRLRLRELEGIDAKDKSRSNKSKGKKIQQIFTEVCAASDDETRGVESDSDAGEMEEENEDIEDHASDDEERPPAKY